MNPKLTPEQQVVADRWERERAARLEAIDEMEAAQTNNDKEAYNKAKEKYRANLGPDYCEHGRSWASAHCIGCEEIERILYPERFQDEDEEYDDE